jgi:hypothetical protein
MWKTPEKWCMRNATSLYTEFTAHSKKIGSRDVIWIATTHVSQRPFANPCNSKTGNQQNFGEEKGFRKNNK